MNSHKKREYQNDRFSDWKTMLVIIVLLVFWAIVLAAGAIANDSNFWRPAVIILGVTSFVGTWLLAVTFRKK